MYRACCLFKKEKGTREIEDHTLLEQNNETNPIPNIPGNASQTNITTNDGLNITYALRNGARSYSRHPICNYVFYDYSSSKYWAFVVNL